MVNENKKKVQKNTIIGDNLSNLRKEAGLQQIELAKKLNLTQPILSAYESGSKLPSTNTLIVLADFFNVSLDWLCGRPGLKYITVADVMKRLVELEDVLVLSQSEISSSLSQDSHTISFFYRENDVIKHLHEFLKEQNKTKSELQMLPDKGLANELYDIWLEKKLKELSKINLN